MPALSADEARLQTVVPKDLARRVRIRAAEDGVSVAELLRRYLAEGLERDARRQAAGE